jgi:uncharacterized membrane protein YeaQ/YmgE (transglycosylase-associated protein family)
MINLILWLLSGAFVGWLVSIVMRMDAQKGALSNMMIGIIGDIAEIYRPGQLWWKHEGARRRHAQEQHKCS